MKKAAASRSPAARPPAGRSVEAGPRSLGWLQGLACGALASLATSVALLLAVLLAPGLLALATERAPGKPVARATLLCGLAAAIGPTRDLWHAGAAMTPAIALATDPATVAVAWSAAAAGWLLGELAPLAVRLVLDGTEAARAARLRAARARFEQDWGLPPADPPG